jgi:hypothetical protein
MGRVFGSWFFAGESITFDLGKRIAVEFTAMHIFGPKQDLKSDTVAEMLVWEPALY